MTQGWLGHLQGSLSPGLRSLKMSLPWHSIGDSTSEDQQRFRRWWKENSISEWEGQQSHLLKGRNKEVWFLGGHYSSILPKSSLWPQGFIQSAWNPPLSKIRKVWLRRTISLKAHDLVIYIMLPHCWSCLRAILWVGNSAKAQLRWRLSTSWGITWVYSCFCGQVVDQLGARWSQIAIHMPGSWMQLLTRCLLSLLCGFSHPPVWLEQPSLHDDKSTPSWTLSFDEYLKPPFLL